MYSRRRKRLILGFGFLAFVLVILLFSVARFFAFLEEKRRYEEEQASLQPRELYTVTVRNLSRDRERRYSAEIAPWSTAEVAAEVSGRVTEVKVETGSRVEKGDPIALIDPSLARMELSAAGAQLEAARLQAAENERLRQEAEELGRRDVISRTELEAARSRARISNAEVSRMKAEIERLSENLDRHSVRAPFTGLIRERSVDAGDRVSAGETVAQIVQADPLRVVFYVTEKEVASFSPGTEVPLEMTALPGMKFQPVVENISRSADPQTRLFRVEARLPNPEDDVLSGTQGVVNVSVEALKDQLFVPTSAVRLVGQRAFAEKVNGDGVPELVEIEIGREIDGQYPVYAGLTSGDRVVVR